MSFPIIKTFLQDFYGKSSPRKKNFIYTTDERLLQNRLIGQETPKIIAPIQDTSTTQPPKAPKPTITEISVTTKPAPIQKPKPSLPTSSQTETPVITRSLDDIKKIVTSDIAKSEKIAQIKALMESHEVIEIQKYATNTVVGDGNPDAGVLFIGEAPGAEEDKLGIPFCGQSGTLLTNAFANTVGWDRSNDYFITNSIFWRPPSNRNPTDEELKSCLPYLLAIVSIIQPKVIILVGSVAAKNILQETTPISKMRQKEYSIALPNSFPEYDYLPHSPIRCLPFFHPSYILRSPGKKKDLYTDIMNVYNINS